MIIGFTAKGMDAMAFFVPDTNSASGGLIWVVYEQAMQ
jgi:hypothetical protein